ncbi:MAG: diguanylate cyclase [Acidobacteriia bacterium]|nr:diguanylate cyclase [Terriglobia bacterium]
MNHSVFGRWPVERKIGAGFVLAFVVLLVVGVVSYRTVSDLVGTGNWVTQTRHVMEHLSNLRSQLDEIEIGESAYIITPEESYLHPYDQGIAAAHETIKELYLLMADPGQRRGLDELGPLINERIALAQRVVESRPDKGFGIAVELMQAGRSKQLTDEIRRRLAGLADREQWLLDERQRVAEAHVRRTYYTLLTGSALCGLILLTAGVIIFRDMDQVRKTEQALQRSNGELLHSVNELERRAQEIGRLSDLGDLLHSCETAEEAFKVIAQCVPHILPSVSGALGVISNSRNIVEIAAVWGEPRLNEQVFPPADCWALRRGRLNHVQDAASALRCRHAGDMTGPYVCLPLMAQGEALGLIHLQRNSGSGDGEAAWMSEAGQKLAGTVADQISLAVANLRLRDALRQQSVRDPLTGLFNRRYMEESVELELRRAMRSSRSMGILMLDLDNFKRFNDSFGHDAGDMMLREFSSVLKAGIRSCDIACRYGGEEFALILPEATLEVSRQRAEQLRECARHLNVQHRLQSLGNITVSIGVAAFPEHGNRLDTLLQAADEALYRAKREGRDRVMTAPVGS